jgi:hypothetical protein
VKRGDAAMQGEYFHMRIAAVLAWGLALCPALGAAEPTEAMFKGQVTVVETGGLSLQGRADEICRSFAEYKDGGSFFTAWAFPVFERIHSCQRRYAGGESEPVTIQGRDGRIVVNSRRGHGLNVSDAPGAKQGEPSWGVLVFLYQVENGRCQIRDAQLLAPDRTYDLGSERLAWLGAADAARGLEFIRGLLKQDAVVGLRKHLVFALYMLDGSAAVADLVGLARHDPEMDIRKDAIFWLGQKASAASVQALGEVIASPEILEVKKHAVFALSQLSEDRGTPLLLEIARRNPHPALRKEAIFWLGESGDPRALDFFESILLH